VKNVKLYLITGEIVFITTGQFESTSPVQPATF